MSHWFRDLSTVYEGTHERKVKLKDMGGDDATQLVTRSGLLLVYRETKH